MTHEDIKTLISAYIDGEAGPSEKEIVEEHLKSCPSCQKDYKTYKAISSSLSKWPNERLSPDQELKVQKRFEQRRESMFSFSNRNLMALGTALALTVIVGSVAQKLVQPARFGMLQARIHDASQYRRDWLGGEARLKSAADDFGDQYSGQDKDYRWAAGKKVMAPQAAMAEARSATAIDAVSSQPYSQPYYLDAGKNLQNGQQASVAGAAGYDLNEKQAISGGLGSQQAVNGLAYQKENIPFNAGQKIIKNAQVSLKVKSAQEAQNTLEGLVAKFNGIINSFNMNKMEDGSRRGVMVLSIFPQDMDNFLREIRGLGEVEAEEQVGSDVTNQYTYLQARLQSYAAERTRLQKVLDKNGRDVGNNIYLQGQISAIEENMNAMQTSLKNLDKETFMSTVTVNFYDTVESVHKPDTLKETTISALKERFKSTLLACYNIALNSFSGIVIVLSFLFQIGLWSLLFWGIYLFVRKFYKK